MRHAGFDLLAQMARATAAAHTDATLLRGVSDVLVQHADVRSIELGRCNAGLTAAEALVHRPRAQAISTVTRSLRRTVASEAVGSGCEIVGSLKRVDSRPDARRAVESGATSLCVVALRADDETAYLSISLGSTGDGVASLGRELLEAIAAIVSGAMKHNRVLERLAVVSRNAHVEGRELRRELAAATMAHDVVALSPAMRRLLDDIVPLVARHGTTVLLRGETGVGKEVLARQIHRLSARNSRTFVKLNCGALPQGLVESALFGHERGAFTGAVARHVGSFERAHGGTLLLDEVAELPLATQVKLLRVLQDGELERVGGDRSIRVDVRVVAATHRPLESMVDAGTFRGDLYYRLNVFPIEIPPLRDRPEDIAPLASAIVGRLARAADRAAPQLTAATVARLCEHDWPGNVRELENVLEHAFVLTRGPVLSLPRLAETRLTRPAAARRLDHRVPTYREAARACIETALQATGGRIYGPGGAAAALGLKPTTLQSKMKKLGVRRARTT
jgi:transcriptional regulator with GAF, ATPase, and Fis domain